MTRTAAASPAVYREHPIKILRYSAKNLWLLIFPLLRSLRFIRSRFRISSTGVPACGLTCWWRC